MRNKVCARTSVRTELHSTNRKVPAYGYYALGICARRLLAAGWQNEAASAMPTILAVKDELGVTDKRDSLLQRMQRHR